jgi:prepilin-type N-terminal cleavage/methylation domain-containing protein
MNSMLMRSMSGQRGFTLTEVLVAVFVILVGLVAIATGFQYATSGVATGRGETMATFLAQQRIEQLKTVAISNYEGPWPSGPSLRGGSTLTAPVVTTEYCQTSDIGATTSNCQATAFTGAVTYTRTTRIWVSVAGANDVNPNATLNLGTGCNGPVTTTEVCRRIHVSVTYRPVTSQGDVSQTRTVDVYAIVAPRS